MKTVLVSALVSAVVSAGMFFLLSRGVPGLAKEELVDVPSLAGLTPDQARQLLDPRGLMLELIAEVEDTRYPAGAICDQSPLRNSRVARGSVVRAKVVSTVEQVKVPAVVGRSLSVAKAMFEAVHLKVGTKSERPQEGTQPGTVLEVKPGVGTEVKRGEAVDLVVVPEPPKTPVPKVVGRYLGSAKRKLEEAGFEVGKVRYGRNEDLEDGRILSQTPEPETPAVKGTKVELVVNETD